MKPSKHSTTATICGWPSTCHILLWTTFLLLQACNNHEHSSAIRIWMDEKIPRTNRRVSIDNPNQRQQRLNWSCVSWGKFSHLPLSEDPYFQTLCLLLWRSVLLSRRKPWGEPLCNSNMDSSSMHAPSDLSEILVPITNMVSVLGQNELSI